MGWMGPIPDYAMGEAWIPPEYHGVTKTEPDQCIGKSDVRPLVNLLEELDWHQPVAIDTETTGLFPYQDDVIRGVSLAWHDGAEIRSYYVPVNYPDNPLDRASIVEIFTALRTHKPFQIFHHGKFDIAFLQQLPMDKEGGRFFPFPKRGEWWDTQVVAWLLDENGPTGLKPQSVYHFGADADLEQKEIKALVRKVGWGGLTAAQTAPYAAKDAELTLRLYERQCLIISERNTNYLGVEDVPEAIERELLIQGVLYRMGQTGILVNEKLLEQMTLETGHKVEQAEAVFKATYGASITSPKQLGKLLYDELKLAGDPTLKTPDGFPVYIDRSTARARLETLPAHQAVDHILEHRRLKKAMTGYLVPFRERLGKDGRIHAGFSSTRTVTGRFSCSDPNLQTIPRGDTLVGVRDIFIPEPGFELWEYDLAGAELRVLAGMAGETRLIEQLESGADMHSENARSIFGPNFTGLQRRSAKNIMYGWAYGLNSVMTASRYIVSREVSLEQAKTIARKVLDGIKVLYPAMFALMQTTTAEADLNGYVRINETRWPGRFRRFISPHPQRQALKTYTALNAKVQGGIGELMKDVMLVAEPLLERAGARICLQVHDSLVIEVPEGELAGQQIQAILQAVLDQVNPFAMQMLFDAAPWSAHD